MTKSIDSNYVLGSTPSSNRYYNSMMSNSFNNVNSCPINSNTTNCNYQMNMNTNNCCVNSSNNCESSCNNENSSRRAELLKEIMSLDFALTELQLYLNNHPEDEKALCLYKKYAKELKELKDGYQKVYGPLTKEFPCNKWRWLEEPWPWEGGIF